MFLVVQIRQANQNQRAMIQQGRATRTADFLLRVIDPALLPAWTMGLRGATDIGSDRHFQFMYMARARFLSLEDSFLQHRNGLMDEGAFVGLKQKQPYCFISIQIIQMPRKAKPTIPD